jgi:hypothetical protein
MRVLDNGNLCIEVPLSIKHKRGRKIIIAPETLEGKNAEAESPVQSALVQALARAHAWMDALESGKAKHVRHLASKLNLDSSYVGQLLRLVNLAPDIQEAIIRGEEPDGLSLVKLRSTIPDDWQEQKQMFRMTS